MSLKEQQQEWARLANAGDRQALDSLTISVRPWTRRKAIETGRKFKLRKDEWMDLEQEGLSRIVYVLRSYSPEKGSFLNYFASCSARWMSEVANRWNTRSMINDTAIGIEKSQEEKVDESADIRAEVERCRSAMPPMYLEVLDGITGFYGGNDVGIAVVSRKLGITQDRCKAIYRMAIEQMKAEFLKDDPECGQSAR